MANPKTHEPDLTGQFCKHCGVGMGGFGAGVFFVSLALCPVANGYTVATPGGWVKLEKSEPQT